MVGARPEDLDRVEQTLGVVLPGVWRDRLLVENGFELRDPRGLATGEPTVWWAVPVLDRGDRKRMLATAEDIAWHTRRAPEIDGVVIARHEFVQDRRLVLGPDGALSVQVGDRPAERLGITLDELLAAEAVGLAAVEADAPLPVFRYHPDPVATGSIRRGAMPCPFCGRSRGWAYVTTPYGRGEWPHVCPWCIADGTAAAGGASFVDAHPLLTAGVPRAAVDEVCARTPGFASWQQEDWQVHCGDACAYLGELDLPAVLDLPADLRAEAGLTDDEHAELLAGSGAVVHGFRCLHCRTPRIWLDLP